MTEKIKYRKGADGYDLNAFSTVYSRCKKVWNNYQSKEISQPYGLTVSQQFGPCCAWMSVGNFDQIDNTDMEFVLSQVALWGRKAVCWVTERQEYAWKYLMDCPYAKCLSETETRMVKTNPYKVRMYEIEVPRDAIEGLPQRRKDA